MFSTSAEVRWGSRRSLGSRPVQISCTVAGAVPCWVVPNSMADTATLVVSVRHEHPLRWLPPPGQRFACSGCKEEGRNGGFTCTLPSCNDFVLHPECAQLPRVLQNSIHVSEDLDFRSGSKIRGHNCSACQNTIRGFLLKAPRRRRRSRALLKPSLRFHPLCITLPLSFTFTEHADHRLRLVKDKDEDYNCSFCSRLCRGWRYDCQSCGYTLDLLCAKLDMHGLLEHRVQDPSIPQQGNRIDVNPAAAVSCFGRLAGAIGGGVLGEVIVNAIP